MLVELSWCQCKNSSIRKERFRWSAVDRVEWSCNNEYCLQRLQFCCVNLLLCVLVICLPLLLDARCSDAQMDGLLSCIVDIRGKVKR